MLNTIIRQIGRLASYSVLIMAVLTLFIVVARYGFNWSSIALQESVLYLHALLFMLTIPWALDSDNHVRVDVFYRQLSAPKKSWINALGHIALLLPFAVFVLAESWSFALESWLILEESPNAGGLPFVYILKTIIPVSFLLLILQALCQLVDEFKILVLSND